MSATAGGFFFAEPGLWHGFQEGARGSWYVVMFTIMMIMMMVMNMMAMMRTRPMAMMIVMMVNRCG